MGKVQTPTIIGMFQKLSVDEQVATLERLTRLTDASLDRRLTELRAAKSRMVAVKKVAYSQTKQTRTKPEPKYRSRVDKSLTWTGRGSLPSWLVTEMKVTRKKLPDFAIKGAK